MFLVETGSAANRSITVTYLPLNVKKNKYNVIIRKPRLHKTHNFFFLFGIKRRNKKVLLTQGLYWYRICSEAQGKASQK